MSHRLCPHGFEPSAAAYSSILYTDFPPTLMTFMMRASEQIPSVC